MFKIISTVSSKLLVLQNVIQLIAKCGQSPDIIYMSLKSEKRCVIIPENIFGFKGMTGETVNFEICRPLVAAPPVSDVEYQAGGGKRDW